MDRIEGGYKMSIKNIENVTIQSRLRSPVLWSTIFTFTIFVLKTYFDIEIPQADKLINGILLIATLLGIINNPSFKNKL